MEAEADRCVNFLPTFFTCGDYEIFGSRIEIVCGTLFLPL